MLLTDDEDEEDEEDEDYGEDKGVYDEDVEDEHFTCQRGV